MLCVRLCKVFSDATGRRAGSGVGLVHCREPKQDSKRFNSDTKTIYCMMPMWVYYLSTVWKKGRDKGRMVVTLPGGVLAPRTMAPVHQLYTLSRGGWGNFPV